MPEYRIEGGDSNVGTVGFAAYVTAKNKREALKRLRDNVTDEGYRVERFGGVEIRVYLSPRNLTLKDVERSE